MLLLLLLFKTLFSINTTTLLLNVCEFQASQAHKGNQVHAEIQVDLGLLDRPDQVEEQEAQVFKVLSYNICYSLLGRLSY